MTWRSLHKKVDTPVFEASFKLEKLAYIGQVKG